MIIRSLGARHGSKILASASRSCCRALSTERPFPTTVAAAEATPEQPLPPQDGPSLVQNQWKLARDRSSQVDTAPDDFRVFHSLQKRTKKLGSKVERRYVPDDLLNNPPHDASLELLMASQAHMGHHTSLWNPGNSRYIYGVRAGIHIISLEVTAAHLRRASRVVEEVAYHGGLILFVGNRPGQMPIVVRAAQLAGACHLFERWTPGTITNRDQILSGSALRVVDARDRELPGFEDHLLNRRALAPDLVVCLNPLENYTMLHECGLENVPTIGIIDTDADPTWVTYPIPANDDSLRAATLIAGVLGRAGQRGQARRLKDAEEGRATWQTPRDVKIYMDTVRQAGIREAEKGVEDVLGKRV